MMEHVVHLSSNTASQYYSSSSGSDFTIPLARPLELPGRWRCWLEYFHCTKRPSKQSSPPVILVCADICADSIVNRRALPVVAALSTKYSLKSYLTDSYVTVRSNIFTSINVYLRDEHGDPISVDLGTVSCALHLIQDGSHGNRLD